MATNELNLNHLQNSNLSNSSLEENDLLIEKHISYVEAIASKIIKSQKIPPCIDFGDLVSWGIEGLIKAKSKFNPDSNTKFETYAFYRIRGEILDSIRKEWKYRVPKEYLNSKKKFKEQLSDFIVDQIKEAETSQESEEKISDNLIENAAVATFLSNDVSLAISKGKGMQDPEIEQIDEAFHEIWDEIDTLNEEEKQVIDLFYIKGLKQFEIAEHMKCSTAKVSRIHYKIIQDLKVQLKNRSESHEF
tara:strand:- start:9022 stop:9762 length:741 start_codon:yes stop_codon:yes gene_type:complete